MAKKITKPLQNAKSQSRGLWLKGSWVLGWGFFGFLGIFPLVSRVWPSRSFRKVPVFASWPLVQSPWARELAVFAVSFAFSLAAWI